MKIYSLWKVDDNHCYCFVKQCALMTTSGADTYHKIICCTARGAINQIASLSIFINNRSLDIYHPWVPMNLKHPVLGFLTLFWHLGFLTLSFCFGFVHQTGIFAMTFAVEFLLLFWIYSRARNVIFQFSQPSNFCISLCSWIFMF